jgi:hypothetical protein
MRLIILIIMPLLLTTIAHAQANEKKTKAKHSDKCTDECMDTYKNSGLACKLTSPELRERKETVLRSLKTQILDRKEIKNGVALKFIGSDELLEELVEFIKTERECCGFFDFTLSISGDKSEVWLEITGPKGVKEFIKTELEI